jgi:hypothetical protein
MRIVNLPPAPPTPDSEQVARRARWTLIAILAAIALLSAVLTSTARATPAPTEPVVGGVSTAGR